MIDDVEAVSKTNHPPIVVHDSGGFACTARTSPGAIVLQPTHHVIEGKSVVSVNLIKLPGGNVIDTFPRVASIVRDRDTSILTIPHSLGISGIDPECVVVDVCAVGNRTKCFAAID